MKSKALFRKILPLLIIAALLLPFSYAFADDPPSPMDGGNVTDTLEWLIYDNGLLKVFGSGVVPDYSAPSKTPWADYIYEITALELTGVEKLGSGSFMSLPYLTSLTLSSNLVEIGNYAFAYDSSILSVQLPSGLKTLGGYAFYDCSSASFGAFPGSIETVGEYAFVNCVGLPATVAFSENLKSIGSYAFSNTGFHTLTFAGDVPSFGSQCFFKLTGPAYASCVKKGWDDSTMKQYGGQLSWAKHRHLTEGLEKKPADCENAGVMSYTCMDCKTELLEPIPATGHKGVHHAAVKAGCTTDGSIEYWQCEYCKLYFSDSLLQKKLDPKTIPVSMKGHVEVKDPGYPAGPETTGLTDGVHCSECGEVIVEQEEIPATGYLLTIEGLDYDSRVCVDGVTYIPNARGEISLPKPPGVLASVYCMNNLEYGPLDELNYPEDFRILFIKETDEGYIAEERENYSDLLNYSGISIRNNSYNGIRLAVTVNTVARIFLSYGTEGLKLEEFGVIMLPEEGLSRGALRIDNPEVRSVCLYRENEIDAGVSYSDIYTRYNADFILSTPEECCTKLVLSAYMVFSDENGEKQVLYHGPVARSISFVAVQNTLTYPMGSDRYNFLQILRVNELLPLLAE